MGIIPTATRPCTWPALAVKPEPWDSVRRYTRKDAELSGNPLFLYIYIYIIISLPNIHFLDHLMTNRSACVRVLAIVDQSVMPDIG